MTNEALAITRSCPDCRSGESLRLSGNRISCTIPACSFSIAFDCPLCEASLGCEKCSCRIPIKKIAYWLNNGLVVDRGVRCRLCNGPTIHRPEMNVGHRCVEFPRCAGQGELFGMSVETLVFLDFETTGLDSGREHIIEIGALKIDHEGYEHVFNTFVEPPVSIDYRITGITGITDAMVQGAPNSATAVAQLLTFIGNAKIVAHNADFDLPWLMIAANRHGLEVNATQVICTLKWARALGEPHCSLGALSKKYQISHHNAHRALADATVTKELFFVLESKANSVRPIVDIDTYRKIAEQAAARTAGRVARSGAV